MSTPYPEDRLSYLQGAYEQIDKRMDFFQQSLTALRDEMERRFDRVDRRFERLETKFDGKFESLQSSLNATLRWSVGTILAVGAAILAAVLAVR